MVAITRHCGLLDKRLTVLRATYTNNEYNEPIETWVEFVSVWAERKDVSLGEMIRAAELGAKITAHFLIRYSPETSTITAKDRIETEGLTYNIIGIRELERDHWYEVHAVARTDT
jgi:SPP1 family predicted phage head-tail adaptor